MDFFAVKSTRVGKEDYCSIYARVREKGINKKYAIGFFIKKSEWEIYNSNKYAASTIMESIGIRYGLFANALEQIKVEFETNFNPLTASETIQAIKKSVIEGIRKKKDKSLYIKKKLLTDYMEQCVEDFKSGRRTAKSTGKPLSKSSIKNYKTCLNSMWAFEKACNETVTLDNVDMDFQRAYVSWLVECGRHANFINSQLYNIRYIMKMAFEDKLTKNTGFMHRDFVPKAEIVDQIFLTPSQICELANFDISSQDKIVAIINKTDFYDPERKNDLLTWLKGIQGRHLDEAKDIFLVGCYTGQRFSDYSRLDTKMICTLKNKKYLNIIQKKTGKKVLIPYDVRVQAILEKYHGKLPQINIDKLNYNIKLIAELIGWTYDANIDESRMGAKRSKRFCDLISSHTARRSFATNAYAAGVPLKSIMAVTGHSREEKLRIYLKLQAEDKAVIAANDFKGVLEL